jgi:hypothetical protein
MQTAMKAARGLAPRPGPLAAEPALGPPRPLSYWLARTPPGWISRHSAKSANPLALAKEIHALGSSFVGWLARPRQERWDTFTLQALSAALFNRFQLDLQRGAGRMPASVELLQLSWPVGSEDVQHCLADLQRLLAGPLAVYKAIRTALPGKEFPTRAELRLADDALEAARGELEGIVDRLGAALDAFNAGNRESVR